MRGWVLALLLGMLAVPAQAETVTSVTQYSYDALGRLTCTAVRMNPAAFGASPASACNLGAVGADGPDRITYTQYDEAGRLWRVTSGYGTSAPNAQRVEKTVTYTDNGQEQTVSDGKGNLTTYEYDDLDRLVKVRYPMATNGLVSSTIDYDEYTYDAASNRLTWRKRDCVVAANCTTITYAYDALNRLIYRDNPEVWSYYDNLGRPTTTYSGDQGQKANSVYYDALGRPYIEYQYLPAGWVWMKNDYDLAGRRTRLTWSDEFHVDYEYDLTGAVTAIKENGSFVLSALSYDDLGRRTLLAHANGVHTRYGYDDASRLSSLVHDLAAGQPDQTWGFTYNAVGQVKTRTGWNPAYDPALTNTSRGYTINGLNQAVISGADTLGYDARGNLTAAGAVSYKYDGDNRLLESPGHATLTYDPRGRLQEEAAPGWATRRLAYDGSDLVAEYGANNALLRRYVPGPGADEPLIWYEGPSNTDRRWLHADPQGSIVALTNGASTQLAVNTYDEYGVPGAGNVGTFQYTGQTWLASMGLYHYKARAYSPTLGRFLQTDPIGYGYGLNWYAYVGNDPLNGADPTGETCKSLSCQRQMMARYGGQQAVRDYNSGRAFHSSFVGGLIVGEIPVLRIAGLGLKGLVARFAQGAVGKAINSEVRVGAEITLTRAAQGEAAQHAADAIAAGHPDLLTIARPGAVANRGESIGGMAKVPGKHLDEYPPAMFEEGGAGASVRAINPRDNMSAGACIGNACRGLPDGTKVRIKVTD